MPPVTTYMLLTQVLPTLVGAIVLVVVALRIHAGRQRNAEPSPTPPRPRSDLEEHMAVVAVVSDAYEAEALAKKLIAHGIPALPKVEVIGVEHVFRARVGHVQHEVLRTTVVVPVVDLERARELVDKTQQAEGDATEEQIEQDLERERGVARSTDADVVEAGHTSEGGRIPNGPPLLELAARTRRCPAAGPRLRNAALVSRTGRRNRGAAR